MRTHEPKNMRAWPVPHFYQATILCIQLGSNKLKLQSQTIDWAD
jgi:hypothetical protein